MYVYIGPKRHRSKRLLAILKAEMTEAETTHRNDPWSKRPSCTFPRKSLVSRNTFENSFCYTRTSYVIITSTNITNNYAIIFNKRFRTFMTSCHYGLVPIIDFRPIILVMFLI